MKLLLLTIYHLVIPIAITHAANQYLGCFIDQIGNRDLNKFIGDYEQLTPKQCILACQAQNYPYAAIQYGDECRCGQEYGKYGQVSDEECDYLCSTTEKCGGDNRNSVYRVVNSIELSPADSSLLSERLVRADNDSTLTTNSNSISTSLNNPISESTESPVVITSQVFVTTSSSISISSSINSITSISDTDSSTNTEEIIIPISDMLTTIIPSSTSSITVSQSHTINLVTNTMNSTESSSMYPITSFSSTSSSLYTDTSETTANTVTTVSNPTSSQTSTVQSTSLSDIIQSITITTNIPISSESVFIESTLMNPISSSSITSNNPSSFFPIITTESSQTTEATPEQSSSIISISNTSFLTSNLIVTNFTSIGAQRSITSTLSTDLSARVDNSTVQTTTATAPSSYVISTVIIVPLGRTFDASDNATQTNIGAQLNDIIDLAFQCQYNSSNPNCTLARQRRKRQACSLGYNVNLLSITQLPNINTDSAYLLKYTVANPCTQNAYMTPEQVKAATNVLPRALITRMLNYSYVGDLVRIDNAATTSTPANDRKLWLIGATLGPVGFTLLLIFIFCYLHYKCRPRPTNPALAKAISKAPARTSSHQILTNEPVKEPPIIEKNLHALPHANPLVRASPSPRQLTPIQTDRTLPDATEYSITNEVPLAEIRRQNDVERWRNKLRLQEKFQQSSVPNTTRSEPNHYDNRAFEHDPSNINIQPANDIVAKHSPRPTSKSTEVQVGRKKLHRLLDEVLDKADSDEAYNPDSDAERQKRRRQRRRVNSITNDQNPLVLKPQVPHIPVIPQVSERPDPSIVRLRYNPYEAGDRAHDISRLTPVELKPKYSTDDQRSTQYSARSNPPLFYDESSIADRAATATDAYAQPKRFGKARLETDREAIMRHDGGRIEQRQHKFNGDAVHIDSIPRNQNSYRVQARAVWVEPDLDDDSFEKRDFHSAKRSLANTRNIISSIQDELHHFPGSKSGDYHA